MTLMRRGPKCKPLGSVCRHGHRLNSKNSFIDKRGAIVCRQCHATHTKRSIANSRPKPDPRITAMIVKYQEEKARRINARMVPKDRQPW